MDLQRHQRASWKEVGLLQVRLRLRRVGSLPTGEREVGRWCVHPASLWNHPWQPGRVRHAQPERLLQTGAQVRQHRRIVICIVFIRLQNLCFDFGVAVWMCQLAIVVMQPAQRTYTSGCFASCQQKVLRFMPLESVPANMRSFICAATSSRLNPSFNIRAW